MTRIKSIVEVIKAVWPILVFIVPIVIAIICGIVGVGSTPVQVTLPLSVVIAFLALAFYPIAKAVQWLLNKKSAKIFEYGGLLWMPARLRFDNPRPICPEKDCGCEIVVHTESSLSLQPVRFGIVTPQHDKHYTYECPIHGTLSNVPDISPDDLVMKAKIVQSR